LSVPLTRVRLVGVVLALLVAGEPGLLLGVEVLLVAAIFSLLGVDPESVEQAGVLLWVGGIVIAGRHVHHFNFGIGLLTAVGGVAVHGQESARRHSVTAAAYGAATSGQQGRRCGRPGVGAPRRAQQDTLGHRGRRGDLLYGIRRVLLRGAERHTPASYGRLLAGLAAGDPDDQVATAWIATQELRPVYGAADLTQARDRLFTFYRACAEADVPELHRLARTISTWQNQLLAYFATNRASNGPTEAGRIR